MSQTLYEKASLLMFYVYIFPRIEIIREYLHVYGRLRWQLLIAVIPLILSPLISVLLCPDAEINQSAKLAAILTCI